MTNNNILTAAVLIALLLLPSACTPNYTDKYAKGKDLPNEIRNVTKALPYDEATVKLLDEIAALPQSIQVHPVTVNYLKTVCADGNVRWEEISKLSELNHDGDAFTLGEETEYGTDPLKPNPTVKYALDKGLSGYIEHMIPMDDKNGSKILNVEDNILLPIKVGLLLSE